MMRKGRAASATFLMLSTISRSVPAFLLRSASPRVSVVRSDQRAIGQWPATLALAKGFGDPPKSTRPKQPADGDGDGDAARKNKAKSLMPLADAASKLLPKESADGSVKFSNPGVGDFQVFDALVKYPGAFELKIIGVDDESFVGDIRNVVAGCLTKGEEHLLKCTTREKGKYVSISLKVYVESSTQLYKCYEVINEDSRVKFKF
ncbi:unnamed protein product [Ascophyllum nodosum]